MGNKLPCPKHGHPAQLSIRQRAWVDFYNIIAPYSMTPNTLDHHLISKLCTELDLSFLDAFEKLKIIQDAVSNADKRNQNGNKPDGTAAP